MTSSRLPGKVLLDLAGQSVLAHVLRRCAAINGVDAVCCAVPVGASHDPIAEEARRTGADVFRGSELDVLDRYWRAAKAMNATVIMRVTSDCPLIAPEVCAEVLARLAESDGDYACNNMPPSFPHGLDCEAFTVEALEKAWRFGHEPQDREHVTPWLRRAPEIRRSVVNGPGGRYVGMRWTLDFPEDYEFFAAVFAVLPKCQETPDWQSVSALLDAHPEINDLNAARHQR